MSTLTLQDLLTRLDGARRSGNGWSAKCPGHEDRHSSLSVSEDGDVLLLHCFSGCPPEQVMQALGLRMADLFPERRNGHHAPAPAPRPVPPGRGLVPGGSRPEAAPVADPVAWLASHCAVPRDYLATLPLEADGGQIAFRFGPLEVRKLRQAGSKSFAWAPSGAATPPLWPLPDGTLPETIWLSEGETDAIVLRHLGLTAFAMTHGAAGTLKAEHVAALRQRGVQRTAIAFDADEPGRAGARKLAEALQAGGIGVASVDLAEVGLVNPLSGEKDLRDVWRRLQDAEALRERLSPSGFVSSRLRGGCDETNSPALAFARLADVLASVPPEPAWLWRGYLAPESLTLLAGRPKVGKSTLGFGLLAALRDGSPFLGQETRPARVVLLTEERSATLADKARRWGPLDHVDVLLRHQAAATPWPEVVRQAVAHAQATGAEVLMVDTFSDWATLAGDAENAAGAVLEAIRPLQAAAAGGLAVLLVAHQRKSSGEHGDAVRGSNALTGGVDVVLELERPAGGALAGQEGVRVLCATSRFEATPAEVVAELGQEGYAAKGDTLAAQAEAERARLLAALGEQGQATADDLATALGLPKATAHKRLGELLAEGAVAREGEGKRGSPFRWSLPGFVSSQPPLKRDETNPTAGQEPPPPADDLAERPEVPLPLPLPEPAGGCLDCGGPLEPHRAIRCDRCVAALLAQLEAGRDGTLEVAHA